jgi:AcrR family transcriptional regulator
MTDNAARHSQQERRAEAERRLILAAAELVGEIGPARVTLAGVGERAGYSRGLATHHFGSKGALMQRLVGTVTEQFREAIRTAESPRSAFDEILALVDTYFTALADLQPANRARLVLWADAAATGSPDVRPAMVASDNEFRGVIGTTLRRGVDGGEFPSAIEPAGLAAVIVGMLRGVALQALLDEDVDLNSCRTEIRQLLVTRLQKATLR